MKQNRLLQQSHKYTERLKGCKSKTGRDAIENEFKIAMERDLEALTDELKLEDSRILLSSNLVTALTVGAGALAALALPMVGLPAAAGVGIFGTTTIMATINQLAGVNKARLDYKKDRNKVLKDHSMSYLHSVANR